MQSSLETRAVRRPLGLASSRLGTGQRLLRPQVRRTAAAKQVLPAITAHCAQSGVCQGALVRARNCAATAVAPRSQRRWPHRVLVGRPAGATVATAAPGAGPAHPRTEHGPETTSATPQALVTDAASAAAAGHYRSLQAQAQAQAEGRAEAATEQAVAAEQQQQQHAYGRPPQKWQAQPSYRCGGAAAGQALRTTQITGLVVAASSTVAIYRFLPASRGDPPRLETETRVSSHLPPCRQQPRYQVAAAQPMAAVPASASAVAPLPPRSGAGVFLAGAVAAVLVHYAINFVGTLPMVRPFSSPSPSYFGVCTPGTYTGWGCQRRPAWSAGRSWRAGFPRRPGPHRQLRAGRPPR